jgi:hypothetical protein
MDERYALGDLEDSAKMGGLLERARIKASGTIREAADLMMSDREGCSKRGYHRVSREPEKGEDLMICYDCELWFDKNFAESCGMKYRVEPRD